MRVPPNFVKAISQTGREAEGEIRSLGGTAVSPNAPDRYRWDNWTADFGSSDHIGRFTLEAPRTPNPNERHYNASIGLYLPTPQGFDAFSKVVEETPSWSGSALNLSNLGQAGHLDGLNTLRQTTPPADLSRFNADTLEAFRESALLIPYTSPYTNPPPGFEHMLQPQALSLAYKKPGELSFRTHGTVLDPYATKLNPEALKYYDIGASQHCIAAWRDPFIFFEDGQYHMLFAARYNKKLYDELPEAYRTKHAADSTHKGKGVEFDPEVNSTVGYATSKNLADWELQRPFMLPANATQFELPAMTKTKDGHVLTVAVSNGSVAIKDPVEGMRQLGPRHQYLLAFQNAGGTKTMTQSGAWSSMEDTVNKGSHPLSKIYGPNFLPTGDKVLISAFDETTHDLVNVVSVPRDGFPGNIPNEDSVVWDMPSSGR